MTSAPLKHRVDGIHDTHIILHCKVRSLKLYKEKGAGGNTTNEYFKHFINFKDEP